MIFHNVLNEQNYWYKKTLKLNLKFIIIWKKAKIPSDFRGSVFEWVIINNILMFHVILLTFFFLST